MEKTQRCSLMVFFFLIMFGGHGFAQEVKVKNSLSLTFCGRVQLQHLYNNNIGSDDAKTNNGFRMRRVRLQMDGKLTAFLSGKIQIDIRDNSPRLKDAEGKLRLFENYYFRFGQFKVPVWREEFIRSSGNLILVERSMAAGFLEENLLSARHVGIEFHGAPADAISFTLNFSNGAGEGISEIEKNKTVRVNNGKMVTGRIDVGFSENLRMGISGAFNQTGHRLDTLDATGQNRVIAPDLGLYLPGGLDLEAAVGFGELNRYFIESAVDQSFTIADISARWKQMNEKPCDELGGLSGYEFAAGFSMIDLDDDFGSEISLRFGPALYFGKQSRLQTNLELVDPARESEDSYWKIRSQFTVNL
ncbi:MAG: hypothetical protein EH225_02700 [Calditrichaeota bacterium]|nr:hypothetical protein [Calditrichota bacterium]RQW06933.1 MAG: hypothetical protein EH225_02700 [Calditrichota bacterium]